MIKAALLVFAALAAVGASAQALPASRGMFASAATGSKGQAPPVIKVWPGASLDLDFLATGEIIRKIWLDDESRLIIDDDSCLVSSANSSGQSGQAGACGARVLHLRQAKQPQDPRLTYGPYSYLSVIAETPRGEFKRYRFQVVAVQPVRDRRGRALPSRPEYTSIAIHPDSAGIGFIDIEGGSRRATIDDVLKGLASARAKGLIPNNSPLYARVQNFAATARRGEPLDGSAHSAGVSMALITKLAGMGLEATAPPAPTPEPAAPVEKSPIGQVAPPAANSLQPSGPESPLKTGMTDGQSQQLPALVGLVGIQADGAQVHRVPNEGSIPPLAAEPLAALAPIQTVPGFRVQMPTAADEVNLPLRAAAEPLGSAPLRAALMPFTAR
ncbi:MAG: hypothetical protein IAF94_07980 [Pirellulaceae bacterium]|nr:hypothetical protein [Pirellulaceae bacterium]